MKKELRSLLWAVFVASLSFLAIAALAFVNNVVALGRWWRAFLAAGGDSQSVSAHMPGFLPWLDWTAVDYSAVTTLIPLIGFLCLTVASLRMLCGRRMRVGDFPFFRGSDQLNVALGLFGTLWGIIVIGYFKLDTVSMADLMQCLHTALFSTLMAVVWVFMVDRPLIRPFFTWLLMKSDLAETDDGDLAAAVDRLVVRLGAASDAFDRRQREYEAAFERRQAKADERQAKAEAEAEKRQVRAEAEAERRQAEAETAAERRRAEAEAQARRRQEQTDEAVTRALADLERVRKESSEQCARQLAEYQQAFEARQREYVEFFKREIEALEKRAKDSESRLKAVMQALQS